MKQINIRKAVPSDLPYLYEICLKTGDAGNDATELYHDPYLLGHVYVAPYILFPRGINFVAEYYNRPQGYVVAAADTLSFNKWLDEVWLPPLRVQYTNPFPLARSKKEEKIVDIIFKQQFQTDAADKPWLKDYPAHLHIDLLPDIQKIGVGRKLIDALFAELAKQNITGLHLDVGSINAGAVAFYQKTGFTVLKEHGWGFTMGRKV